MEMRYGTNAKKKAAETTSKKAQVKKKAKAKAKNGKVVKLHKKAAAKKGTTYKDVIIMFLAEGLSLVEKNVESGKVTVSAVRKAAAELKDTFPERADLLSAFADKVQPVSTGRGRSPPKPGDDRDYKAQKIGDNEPFLRLPLGVLGVKKGQSVTVRFQADRLMVTKKVVG
jgi:hypothetical protein